MADDEYGLKIKDSGGSGCVITAESGTIISAGRVTMPSALVDTNKYYTTINLPDTIDFSDLTVLAQPVVWFARAIEDHLYSGVRYLYRFCLDDAYQHYSKNTGTGVMSTLTVGDRAFGALPDEADQWWGIVGAFPVAYWEKLGATSGNTIKIFAATCYCYTANAGKANEYSDSNNWAYTIYTDGVQSIDYMIINKRFNY